MEPDRTGEDRRLPPWSVVASLAVHVLLAVALLHTSPSRASAPPPQSYRVQLVAAAAEEAPERQEPRAAEAAEEDHRPPPPEPTPEPKPETERPTVEKEEEVPEPSEEPSKAPEEGEDEVNVQLDGATFPYPEYLNNIIRQINRHWRKPTGGRHLRAELSFVIHEDGSVSGIEWVRRSGNRAFDLEARGAVEAAGSRGAFGPLPDGYPRDRLRVTFFFDPSTR